MDGLLQRRIPVALRRAITLVPSVLLLSLGFDPTLSLVVSQVVLSFGIPFALVPLIRLTSDPSLVGAFASSLMLRAASWTSAGLVFALNITLLWFTFTQMA
ncbi:divalent metal cation transporter MntH (plasmid) [Arthrobacter sp. Hiyo8]|nr:divalent metal cation transporter MntH [Arthrobacter sp. Hiyo8]